MCDNAFQRDVSIFAVHADATYADLSPLSSTLGTYRCVCRKVAGRDIEAEGVKFVKDLTRILHHLRCLCVELHVSCLIVGDTFPVHLAERFVLNWR